MGVSEFWERVSFDPFGVLFFYLFCVRVTEMGEVGYGWVKVRITNGQSVKI